MGELAASIAHEVNQPLTAVITNANACLRWLANDPPNQMEARESLNRILRDGRRASDVLARIRALVRNTPPQPARQDVNELLREVLALVQDALSEHHVDTRVDLQLAIPPVLGDRVQLQQVILNLVMNGVEAMRAVGDRPRSLVVSSVVMEWRRGRDDGARFGRRHRAGGLRPAVRTVLHDETRRHGPGVVGLPIDRPQPWGSSMGNAQRGGGNDLSRRPSSHGVTVSADTVFVVDDDASVREALESLIRSVGLRVERSRPRRRFWPATSPTRRPVSSSTCGCPGSAASTVSGSSPRLGCHIPVIFMTGHGDIPMSVHAMKAGAIDFLTKPFRDQDLLDAVHQALDLDRARRRADTESSALRKRFDTLTAREQEVMGWVVSGRLNKQIAGEMGTSEITVKVHRGQVMRKMAAESVADLVRIASQLGLPPR